jgi:hypothetical protein
MTMMATTSAAVEAGLPFVARRKRRNAVVNTEVMLGPLENRLPASSYQLPAPAGSDSFTRKAASYYNWRCNPAPVSSWKLEAGKLEAT